MPTRHQTRVTEEILETLRGHSRSEDELLAAYRSLAQKYPDDVVGYLADLIITDEERHHELIQELTAHVEKRATTVPALRPRVDRPLLDATQDLLKRERVDAKELRHLRRELHGLPPDPLLMLMVELMLHDTAKHIEILRFIHTYEG